VMIEDRGGFEMLGNLNFETGLKIRSGGEVFE
jgi:hypothetical protein